MQISVRHLPLQQWSTGPSQAADLFLGRHIQLVASFQRARSTIFSLWSISKYISSVDLTTYIYTSKYLGTYTYSAMRF